MRRFTNNGELDPTMAVQGYKSGSSVEAQRKSELVPDVLFAR